MTNLIGKWAQHREYPHRRGEIAVVSDANAYLYLYLRQDDGTLYRIYYDNVVIYEHRPDTSGPYR